MPNKDGTGPAGKGQRCRTSGSRKGQRGGRDRHPLGGRRSGGGMGAGRQQGQGKKWQPNENR